MKKFFSLILLTGTVFLLGCTKNVPVDTESTLWTGTTSTPVVDKNIPKEDITKESTSQEDNSKKSIAKKTDAKNTAPKRKSYENKVDGFSLQFPGDRTFQEKVYGASVVFSSPITETDNIKENVMIVKWALDKPYTLEEYFLILKTEAMKLAGYGEISSSTIKIDDLDAKKIIYKSTLNSTKLQFQQVLLIKGNTMYTITYTATEATFAEYVQKVNEMLATLEIK